MIILVHSAQNITGLTKFSKLVTEYGQMGVQLFFVLSAYTICLSLDKRTSELRPVMSFYIRRYFRIAPLYYCGIGLYFMLSFFHSYPTDYSLINVMANVLFVHGFYPPANNTVVFGGWSIGTEMAFYLVVPFLFSGISRFRQNRLFILSIPFIGLLVALLFFRLLSMISSNAVVENNSFLYYNLFNQFPVFLLGIALYFFDNNARSKVQYHPAIYFLVFLLITSASGYLFYKNFNFTVIPLLTGIGFVFLIKSFKHINKLNASFLQRIGQLSYSMYILHFLFAWFVTSHLEKNILSKLFIGEINLVICFTMTTVMTALLATVTERTIEKRGIQLGKTMLSKLPGS